MACLVALFALISTAAGAVLPLALQRRARGRLREWIVPLLGFFILPLDDVRLRGDVCLGRQRGLRVRVVHRRLRLLHRPRLLVRREQGPHRLARPAAANANRSVTGSSRRSPSAPTPSSRSSAARRRRRPPRQACGGRSSGSRSPGSRSTWLRRACSTCSAPGRSSTGSTGPGSRRCSSSRRGRWRACGRCSASPCTGPAGRT